jgi:hypothetical protein
MSKTNLSEDLIRFIHTSIPGVPFVEALLLLRSEPAKSWTAEELGDRLYLPASRVSELLRSLCAAGMAIEEQSRIRFQPHSDHLRHMIDRLSESYRDNLIETTKVIHSGAGRSAQIFADAFKLRKDS